MFPPSQQHSLLSFSFVLVCILFLDESKSMDDKDEETNFINGSYQRLKADGRRQTNLFQFFERIPHGEHYRNTILGIQDMKLARNKKNGLWEIQIKRIMQGKSSHQVITIQPGVHFDDEVLRSGGATAVKTIPNVKGNRITLDRNIQGAEVFEVMHFSEDGIRTTYFTSDEYAIDFLRRKNKN